MQIGAEAVVKVSVGLPNLLQHLDIQGELKMQNIACDLMSCDSLRRQLIRRTCLVCLLISLLFWNKSYHYCYQFRVGLTWQLAESVRSIIPSLVYFLSVAVGVLLQPGEAEPLVAPVLSEVAVHRIVLEEVRPIIYLCSTESAVWSNWILHRKMKYYVCSFIQGDPSP